MEAPYKKPGVGKSGWTNLALTNAGPLCSAHNSGAQSRPLTTLILITMCGGVFPTSPNSQKPTGCPIIPFNSDTVQR